MGAITRTFANNITTAGVLQPGAFENASFNNVTSVQSGAVGTGAKTFIASATASGDATIDFTSGIDSTYKTYVFYFINMHPATDDVILTCQFDTGTNTNYNQTITSTFYAARHGESDATNFGYITNRDQAQGTDFVKLNYDVGNGSDECVSGYLKLFDPSNSTFVTQFIARTSNYGQANEAADSQVAGYINTPTAITRVRFKMSSGNMDSGKIVLYGME
jgi:hypothetical protein